MTEQAKNVFKGCIKRKQITTDRDLNLQDIKLYSLTEENIDIELQKLKHQLLSIKDEIRHRHHKYKFSSLNLSFLERLIYTRDETDSEREKRLAVEQALKARKESQKNKQKQKDQAEFKRLAEKLGHSIQG